MAIFDVPDPDGSPREKLEVPRKTWAGHSAYSLEAALTAEGIEPEMVRKLARALERHSEQSLLDAEANYRELEHWGNIHTHGDALVYLQPEGLESRAYVGQYDDVTPDFEVVSVHIQDSAVAGEDWRVAPGHTSAFHSLVPSPDGLLLYAVSTDRVTALNTADGTTAWQRVISGVTFFDPAPDYSNDWLYIGVRDGSETGIIKLQAQTGDTAWTWTEDVGTNSARLLTPVVVNGEQAIFGWGRTTAANTWTVRINEHTGSPEFSLIRDTAPLGSWLRGAWAPVEGGALYVHARSASGGSNPARWFSINLDTGAHDDGALLYEGASDTSDGQDARVDEDGNLYTAWNDLRRLSPGPHPKKLQWDTPTDATPSKVSVGADLVMIPAEGSHSGTGGGAVGPRLYDRTTGELRVTLDDYFPEHSDMRLAFTLSPHAYVDPEQIISHEDDPEAHPHDHDPPAIEGLSNVDPATPNDGDVLVWNAGTGLWTPTAP